MSEISNKTQLKAFFLNTGTTTVPVWSRIDKGASFRIIETPITHTEQYIDEDSVTTSVDSYQVSIHQTVNSSDTFFDYINNIRQHRKVGADAETEILIVYLNTRSPYKTEKKNAVIQIDNDRDDGSSIIYTIYLNGDPTSGTAVVTNGVLVFTED